MDFRKQMYFRSLSLVGLLLLAVGIRVDQGWAILIGIPLWVFLMPWCIYGFSRLSVDLSSSLWQSIRSRKERVPPGVKSLAKRLNGRPPKKLRILPGSGFNAGVNGDVLYMTEALRHGLWTRVGEGVMAHEMAHLARRHVLILSVVILVVGYGVAFILELLGDSSWSTAVAVTITLGSVVLPPLFRRQEYDADSQAAGEVGVETMIHTLRIIGEGGLHDVDGETHPSITKRIARLRNQIKTR